MVSHTSHGLSYITSGKSDAISQDLVCNMAQKLIGGCQKEEKKVQCDWVLDTSCID